ncbi:complement C1q-like protein 4 [Clupea harengus]|uniref:Complement C1q-like protein 4 n=1 Tax=Clupea harengus TaxID=7950 RepID=A0A6P8FZP5_CLUHA|nr:complement C1q-like protein 4 [Clupea harengus]
MRVLYYLLCHWSPCCYLSSESRTAFSVALTDWRRCVGPERRNIDVAYEAVFLNMGMAYNPRTGIFTVPHSGVYSLAVTVFSDAGSPGSLLAACAQLSRNGAALASLREKNYEDQEDAASLVLTLQLSAGDQVSVRLLPGCYLCDDQNHYNTFSGFLLYATE